MPHMNSSSTDLSITMHLQVVTSSSSSKNLAKPVKDNKIHTMISLFKMSLILNFKTQCAKALLKLTILNSLRKYLKFRKVKMRSKRMKVSRVKLFNQMGCPLQL